jgi:hypothetical protein
MNAGRLVNSLYLCCDMQQEAWDPAYEQNSTSNPARQPSETEVLNRNVCDRLTLSQRDPKSPNVHC